MTLQELIQRMKEAGIVYYSVFESWLEWYNYSLKNEENNDEVYGKISGYIWGLLSAGFITPEEKDCLIDEIINY